MRTVNVADQFETRTETVVKPSLVCNPVDLLCLPSFKNPASPSGAFVDDAGGLLE